MSVSPERIKEALAIIDAAPPYSHVPSSKMTLLEAADVIAAALREAQAALRVREQSQIPMVSLRRTPS